MVRFVSGMIFGTALLAGFAVADASAQHGRPAAWDTRVRAAPTPPEPPESKVESKPAPDAKDAAAGKPGNAAGVRKKQPKTN